MADEVLEFLKSKGQPTVLESEDDTNDTQEENPGRETKSPFDLKQLFAGMMPKVEQTSVKDSIMKELQSYVDTRVNQILEEKIKSNKNDDRSMREYLSQKYGPGAVLYLQFTEDDLKKKIYFETFGQLSAFIAEANPISAAATAKPVEESDGFCEAGGFCMAEDDDARPEE